MVAAAARTELQKLVPQVVLVEDNLRELHNLAAMGRPLGNQAVVDMAVRRPVDMEDTVPEDKVVADNLAVEAVDNRQLVLGIRVQLLEQGMEPELGAVVAVPGLPQDLERSLHHLQNLTRHWIVHPTLRRLAYYLLVAMTPSLTVLKTLWMMMGLLHRLRASGCLELPSDVLRQAQTYKLRRTSCRNRLDRTVDSSASLSQCRSPRKESTLVAWRHLAIER